jgi:hypothetical protein
LAYPDGRGLCVSNIAIAQIADYSGLPELAREGRRWVDALELATAASFPRQSTARSPSSARDGSKRLSVS